MGVEDELKQKSIISQRLVRTQIEMECGQCSGQLSENVGKGDEKEKKGKHWWFKR